MGLHFGSNNLRLCGENRWWRFNRKDLQNSMEREHYNWHLNEL